MSDYFIRNIPPAVEALITGMFPDQPTRGHTSPRQGWIRTIICIAALGPERASPMLDLWTCALQIARRRRNEEDLRPIASVRAKFLQEEAEFAEVLQAYQQHTLPLVALVNRLANILYYATQAYVQDYDVAALVTVAERYCQRAGIPEAVAWRCAAAKFLDRAARDVKQTSSEEAAIQRVVDQWEMAHENTQSLDK